MSDQLMRSLMFVPGHNPQLMETASRSRADILLLDLEDSVQPIENKQVARDLVKDFVEKGKLDNCQVYPRVNDRESGLLLKDVMQLTIPGITGFTYPKAQRGEDIYFFDKLLDTIEYEKGLPIGKFKIIPLIETPGAVLNAQEICQSSPRVSAIAFGCEDFLSEIEGIHDPRGDSIFTARSLIAMAARANNVIPVDTVHVRVHDLEDLERNLIIAKELGYEGMLVLHPKEIPLVHQYFSLSANELMEAREMLRLSELSSQEGKGVTVLNGKFIGPPMVLTARKVLRRAELIKMREDVFKSVEDI